MSKPKVIIPMVKPRKIRRLFWDIEVSPNLALTWRVGYKLNIGHDSIVKERAIICICWKWEGSSKVYSLAWDKHQDDKAMLLDFLKVASEADEMVHQNGDRFDMPWFRTRLLFHKLPPLPGCTQIDTLAWAKRLFLFNSNRLDYLGSFLGYGGKLHTGYSLWKDIVLDRCPIALSKMVTYCKRDVILLEKVYQRLAVHAAPKTHAGVLGGGAKWTCPRTGSTNVKCSKTRVTAGGTTIYQMQSLDTGTYYSINASAFAAYLGAKKKVVSS